MYPNNCRQIRRKQKEHERVSYTNWCHQSSKSNAVVTESMPRLSCAGYANCSSVSCLDFHFSLYNIKVKLRLESEHKTQITKRNQKKKQNKKRWKRQKMNCSGSQLHNVFVYGSFQEPDVINVMFDRIPEIVSATLPGLYVPFSLSSN